MGDRPAGGATRPFTIEDLQAPRDRGTNLRRLPAIVRESLELVWQASRRQFVATLALQVVAAAATGLQLLVTKRLLEELIAVAGGTRTAESLLPMFGVVIAAGVLLGSVSAITAHQQELLQELVARHIFDRIIGVSSRVSYEAFEDPVFFDQLERARTSGMFRPMAMVSSTTALMTAAITSVGIAVAVFTFEPLLLPLVIAAAVPLLLATIRNSRQAYTFEYQMTPQNRERIYLMDLLTSRDAAKEVRIFGSVGFLRRRYDALTDERLAELRSFLGGRLRTSLVGTIATAVGGAIALGALVLFLSTGRIGVAAAATAAVAMQLLATRLSSITASLGKLIESGMFLDDNRAFLALAERQDSDERVAAPRSERRFEGLAVENVSFSYPRTSRPVLEDVSLRVDPGEIVALVGENGSGKTTLIKLVCQLYRPQRGRVLWNGTDTADLPAEAVRADMAVIFQDFVQYHLTARDNIALGRAENAADIGSIAAAAERGGAHEFLAALPDGYETRLGRQFYGGHELSVGQWQRLALARAFHRGGQFLVLDEPTAALDPRAEHDLFAQMRQMAQGRSVLLVSHRFSSVRTADRIYVMHEGRIAESGSHDELMALGGHYAELFELQANTYLGRSAAPTQ